MNPCDTVLVVF